jgi:tripartite-type tricarboxylate transporter receptor subunit TctC
MRLVLAAILAALLCASAFAEEPFPSKTLHVIIPFPPAGPPDLMARLVAPRMSELMGRPVVIDNRAGATGTIGTAAVVKAPPDGHVLLLTPNQPIVIAPALMQTPYDPAKDLLPVVALGESTSALVVSAGSPINSLADLIAMAKAKPGAVSFSSSGQGSVGHLTGEMINLLAGIQMLHVPYASAAQSISAVVAGDVTVSGSSIQQSLPLLKAGKLKALGVTGLKPSKYIPELKTLSDQGLKGLSITVWYAAYLPAKTPRPIAQAWRDVLLKAFQDPVVQQKVDGMGIEGGAQEPEGISARIETELGQWRKVVAAAHMTTN